METAFAKDDMYYLEQAAKVQVLAMSTNIPLALVDEETCKATKPLDAGNGWAGACGKFPEAALKESSLSFEPHWVIPVMALPLHS